MSGCLGAWVLGGRASAAAERSRARAHQPHWHRADCRAARIGRSRGLDRRRGREELAGGHLEPREDDGLRGRVPDECGAHTRTQAREQSRHGSRLVAREARDGDGPSGSTAASSCVHVSWV